MALGILHAELLPICHPEGENILPSQVIDCWKVFFYEESRGSVYTFKGVPDLKKCKDYYATYTPIEGRVRQDFPLTGAVLGISSAIKSIQTDAKQTIAKIALGYIGLVSIALTEIDGPVQQYEVVELLKKVTDILINSERYRGYFDREALAGLRELGACFNSFLSLPHPTRDCEVLPRAMKRFQRFQLSIVLKVFRALLVLTEGGNKPSLTTNLQRVAKGLLEDGSGTTTFDPDNPFQELLKYTASSIDALHTQYMREAITEQLLIPTIEEKVFGILECSKRGSDIIFEIAGEIWRLKTAENWAHFTQTRPGKTEIQTCVDKIETILFDTKMENPMLAAFIGEPEEAIEMREVSGNASVNSMTTRREARPDYMAPERAQRYTLPEEEPSLTEQAASEEPEKKRGVLVRQMSLKPNFACYLGQAITGLTAVQASQIKRVIFLGFLERMVGLEGRLKKLAALHARELRTWRYHHAKQYLERELTASLISTSHSEESVRRFLLKMHPQESMIQRVSRLPADLTAYHGRYLLVEEVRQLLYVDSEMIDTGMKDVSVIETRLGQAPSMKIATEELMTLIEHRASFLGDSVLLLGEKMKHLTQATEAFAKHLYECTWDE